MKRDKPDSRLLETDPSAAWAPVFRSLGLPAYQVRIEDNMACIQAPPEEHPRLLEPTIRSALVAHGKALGYRFITLELD
jgi:PP-loop superfamily ATP-utilizing enzyme